MLLSSVCKMVYMIHCTRPHRSHFTTDEADLPFKENVVLVLHFRLAKFLLLAVPSFAMRRTIHVLSSHGVRSLGWSGTRWLLKFGNSDHITMQGFPSLNDQQPYLSPRSGDMRHHRSTRQECPPTLNSTTLTCLSCPNCDQRLGSSFVLPLATYDTIQIN
jgi:hypothetical protein